mmetsp:Transcript_4103/g.6936  ORF Transcript_4103/g.6936 Transcript_4103/m.6936 type:complete len:226 (+) Transcript_4103:153-830(+)
MYAAGSCIFYQSFIDNIMQRVDNSGQNSEQGFYAALAMLNKRIGFKYIPHHYIMVNNVPFHFVGERNQSYTEVVMEGSVKDGKFIMYYLQGQEVVGFCTVGYQNIHLYLWEAMKMLVMPPGVMLQNKHVNSKSIVQNVLRLRPDITLKRPDSLQVPSVLRVEFGRERDEMDDFRAKIKLNMRKQKQEQQSMVDSLKEKYDRDGVEVIEDVSQIGQNSRDKYEQGE